MKLEDLQMFVNVLAGKYDGSTEVEFSVDDEGGIEKMELSHVNHFREITTTVHPNAPESISKVDTIFMVFAT
jgi:hypothetical protein